MSSEKNWCLLMICPKGEKVHDAFLDEESMEGDRKIYEGQGYKVIGSGQFDIEDEFPCFDLVDYPKEGKRFGGIVSKEPNHFIIGWIGGFEISRKDLIALRAWLNKAIQYCGKGKE